MKNFEERKAEIFRRSEERIKERKAKRNHILVVCITFCFILTILSVTILPAVLPTETDIDVSFKGLNGAWESIDTFVSVNITGIDENGAQTETVTDSAKVNEIYSAILNLYKASDAGTSLEGNHTQDSGAIKGDSYGSESSGTKNDGNSSVILDIVLKKEYRICFNTADGSEIQFVLRKNILCNTENDTRIRLSKKQIEELLMILN